MRVLITLCIILFTLFSSLGQVQINTSYDYPIKPGTAKWASLSTGKQMVHVCQIPDSILNKLTTQALAKTCLNYPLFFQHTALNDERKAIDEMIKEFNGLIELSQREDGLKELIKIYKEIPIDKTPYFQTDAKDIPYKTVYVELLLANSRFIDKAEKKNLEDIKSSFLIKYSNKLNRQDLYSLYSIRKTMLLGAIATLKLDSLNSTKLENKEKLKNFIYQYGIANSNELTIISKIITEP